MIINSCGFGNIVVDGHKYNSDLIIYPDGRILDGWRRISGHRLVLDDITELLDTRPGTIIAGTGVFGRMKIEKDLEEWLAQNKIRLIAESNKNAVARFNELQGSGAIGACFHLTC